MLIKRLLSKFKCLTIWYALLMWLQFLMIMHRMTKTDQNWENMFSCNSGAFTRIVSYCQYESRRIHDTIYGRFLLESFWVQLLAFGKKTWNKTKLFFNYCKKFKELKFTEILFRKIDKTLRCNFYRNFLIHFLINFNIYKRTVSRILKNFWRLGSRTARTFQRNVIWKNSCKYVVKWQFFLYTLNSLHDGISRNYQELCK